MPTAYGYGPIAPRSCALLLLHAAGAHVGPHAPRARLEGFRDVRAPQRRANVDARLLCKGPHVRLELDRLHKRVVVRLGEEGRVGVGAARAAEPRHRLEARRLALGHLLEQQHVLMLLRLEPQPRRNLLWHGFQVALQHRADEDDVHRLAHIRIGLPRLADPLAAVEAVAPHHVGDDAEHDERRLAPRPFARVARAVGLIP